MPLERAYCRHAVPRPGVPVFLTGQVAWDAEGRVVGVGDIAAQVAQVWQNLLGVLEGLGATAADIVKLTTFATDRAFIPSLHAERSKHFEDGEYPASTFLQVAGLAGPELLVEIEATLMLPPDHPAFRPSAS